MRVIFLILAIGLLIVSKGPHSSKHRFTQVVLECPSVVIVDGKTYKSVTRITLTLEDIRE